MTDRLEELLELVQDEERPEGLLDWLTVRPAPGLAANTGRAGGGAQEPAGRLSGGQGGVEQPAGEQPAGERPGGGQAAGARDGAGENAGAQARTWAGEDRPSARDRRTLQEPAAPAQAADWTIETARRRSGQVASGQEEAGPGASGAAEERGAASYRAQDQGALGLYRRLLQAGRAAQAARPTGQTTVAEQTTTGAPSLTVDELDRAVRRDSRRYDAGMELY